MSAAAGDDARRAQVLSFFETLLARDGAGGSWLSALIEAAPRGEERFGELARAPGWLQAPLAVHTQTGLRGAFEYQVAPPRALLAWFVDHPDALAEVVDDPSPETERLRRALIGDEPPGARARAQDRARELLRRSPPLGPAWWRFEESSVLDCVLSTDRVTVVVQGRLDGPGAPATPWFPDRSELVRDLEAAQRVSEGRPWGLLLISEAPAPDGTDGAVAAAVRAGTPQLDEDARAELREGYLGNLTWAQARAAVGVEGDGPSSASG